MFTSPKRPTPQHNFTTTVCSRCGLSALHIAQTNPPTPCISDAQLAERQQWLHAAQAAAHAMQNLRSSQ